MRKENCRISWEKFLFGKKLSESFNHDSRRQEKEKINMKTLEFPLVIVKQCLCFFEMMLKKKIKLIFRQKKSKTKKKSSFRWRWHRRGIFLYELFRPDKNQFFMSPTRSFPLYKVLLSTNFTIENKIFYGVSLGNLANENAFMLQKKNASVPRENC